MPQAHEFFDVAIVGTDAPPATPDPEAYYISLGTASSPGTDWEGLTTPFIAQQDLGGGSGWNISQLTTRGLYYDTVERQLLSWDGTALRSPVGGLSTAVIGGDDSDSTDYTMDATFQSIGLTVTGIATLGGSVEVQAIASCDTLATFEFQLTLNGSPLVAVISNFVQGYFPFEHQFNFDDAITVADVLDVSVRETSGAAINPFIRGSKITSILTVYESRFAPLSIHAGDHTSEGLDPVVGDIIDLSYVPAVGYVPAVKTGITSRSDQITSHFNGVALALSKGIISDCILNSVGQTQLLVGVDTDSSTLNITQNFTGLFQVVLSGFIKSTHVLGTTVTFNLYVNGIDDNNTTRLTFSNSGSDFAVNFFEVEALVPGDTVFIRMTAEGRDATLDNTIVTDAAAGTLLCVIGINSGGSGPILSAMTTFTAEAGTDIQAVGADTINFDTGQGLRTEATGTKTLTTSARDTPALGTPRFVTSATPAISLVTGTKFVLADGTSLVGTITLAQIAQIEDGSSVWVHLVETPSNPGWRVNIFPESEDKFTGLPIGAGITIRSPGDVWFKVDTTPATNTWLVSQTKSPETTGFGPKWRSNIAYYSSMFSGRQLTTSQKAAGQIQFMPFNVPNTIDLVSLKVEVTATDPAGTINTGLYYSSLVTLGEPGELLAPTAALADASTLGVRTLSFATTVTLDPGTYWTAISMKESGIGLQSISVAGIDFSYGSATAAASLGSQRTARTENTVFGALPPTAAPSGHSILDQALISIITL